LNRWDPPSVGGMPLYLAYGGSDPVADPIVNRDFFTKLQSTDKTIDERKDKFHEILNETDRNELFQGIIDWMLTRIK